MKKIQCETCGSTDIIKINDDYFQCEYCGIKYTTEQARKLFNKIDGILGLEELKKNAQTFFQIKEYNKSWKLYKEITNKYPDQSCGWYGLFELSFNFSFTFTEEASYDVYYERALKFATEEEKAIIINKYEEKIRLREEEYERRQNELRVQKQREKEEWLKAETERKARLERELKISEQKREINNQINKINGTLMKYPKRSSWFWMIIVFLIGLLFRNIVFFTTVCTLFFILYVIWVKSNNSTCKRKINELEQKLFELQ